MAVRRSWLWVVIAIHRLWWWVLSILVVGPVDVSGPSSSSVDPGGASSWPIVDGCGGHSLRFVGVVRREG